MSLGYVLAPGYPLTTDLAALGAPRYRREMPFDSEKWNEAA